MGLLPGKPKPALAALANPLDPERGPLRWPFFVRLSVLKGADSNAGAAIRESRKTQMNRPGKPIVEYALLALLAIAVLLAVTGVT